MSTRTMSGGRALAEMLAAHAVGPMFGMGGFQLLPFYDAVAELGLQHHLINDERAGVFAADAYARMTGRPGVCDGTLGPGATNMVTGLVESLNAGIPLVAITGNTNRQHSWKNMTQEARQVEILGPAVKELIRIEEPGRIPELVRRAFAVATSGRPGPVVLDVPEDVCHAQVTLHEAELVADPTTCAAPSLRSRPDAGAVERAAEIIRDASRPVLLVGGGVHLSRAYGELLELAESLQIPVAHTLSGKGSIPCTHELSAGLFGRYSRIANDLIDRSDCLVVVGCKLGEIATRRYDLIPPSVPLIHLDITPEEIGRTTAAHVGLWADAAAGLRDLRLAVSEAHATTPEDRAEYVAEVCQRMEAWRSDSRDRLESDERPINLARLINELNAVLPADAVLVADGGFAAHWTGLLYDTKRAGRAYVADRGLASIGYGLPGAIGVQLADRSAPVFSLTGDGGFNMSLGELETARRLGLPLTMLVVNNAASGYVKALQHAMFGGRYQSSDLAEIDYAAVARAMGCEGIRVEAPDEIEGALRTALAARSVPLVLDVVVTRDPAKMLPGVDSRAKVIKPGDRIA